MYVSLIMTHRLPFLSGIKAVFQHQVGGGGGGGGWGARVIFKRK